MRRSTKHATVVMMLSLVGLVACKGGGGTLDSMWNGWDENHGTLSQRERPITDREDPQNREVPPDSLPDKKDESPAFGPGTFACDGIYECIITGTTTICVSSNGQQETCSQGDKVTVRVKIKFQQKDGVCAVGKSVLDKDGSIINDDGEVAGTWALNGDGISVKDNEGDAVGVCIRSSGPEGLVGIGSTDVEGTSSSGSSGGSSTSSSSSSSSSSGDISIDPGPGQVDGGR